MNKRKFLIAVLFSAGIVVYISGCAASSGSMRYHNAVEKPDDNASGTRYGSKEDDKNASDVANEKADTSDIDLTTADSDPDDIPANSKKFDISSIIKKYSTKENNKNLTPEQISGREKILMEIIKYIDTPYQYGGNTQDGIDCSAFTQSVFDKTLSIELQRSARDQYQEGNEVGDKDDLQFGDLVFFNTRRRVKPGHVGIYIGNHLFAHASSRNGVTVSSLDEDYYSKRFMGARRVEDMAGSGTAVNNN